MVYARHIGRVGALAVALGVGAALVTTPAIAFAESPDSGSSSPASDSAQPAADTAGERSSGPGVSPGRVAGSADESGGTGTSSVGDAADGSEAVADRPGAPTVVVRHSGGTRNSAAVTLVTPVAPGAPGDDDAAVAEEAAGVERTGARSRPSDPGDAPGRRDAAITRVSTDPTVAPEPATSARDRSDTVQPPPASSREGRVQPAAVAQTPFTGGASAAASPSTEAPAQPAAPGLWDIPNAVVNVASELVSAALSPLLAAAGVPGVPSPTSALFVMLAYVRREIEHSLLPVAPGAGVQQVGLVEAGLSFNPIGWLFDLIQDTFFAATPTYPDHTQIVVVNQGQTSQTFELGGEDADGRSLTYSVDGTGSAGGTLTISGSTATYTPPPSWPGAAATTDTFTVTTSDFWNLPHIHGFSGLLHLMTFGIFGDAGHTATGKLTVSVVPTALATFPVTFVNNSGVSSDDIYVTVMGQTSKDQWAWVDQNGVAHHINSADANADGHLEKDGINYANMSYTLSAAGGLRIPPEFQGARIYTSIGAPLYLSIAADNSGWTVPDPVNQSDPNYNTVYDWIELTYTFGSVPFGGNTTQVDQFGLPLSFQVLQNSSNFDETRGMILGTTRDQVFSTYQNTVPAAFLDLVIGDPGHPLRIASPRSLLPASLQNWFQAPIDAFWNAFSTPNSFSYTNPGYTVTGSTSGNTFTYTVTPTGQPSQTFTMAKPTTAEVFAANGVFVGTETQGAFLAELNAAFNRGVANSPQNWDNAAFYYPTGPGAPNFNSYAQVFHILGINGDAYGFPYDDVNSQSSVLILNNDQPPSNLIITLNPGT